MSKHPVYYGLKSVSEFFDWLDKIWEGRRSTRLIGTLLVTVYIVTFILIGLNRAGWFPPPFDTQIPTTFFFAIEITFTLVLVDELIRLVFGLARSVSRSIGIQLEILSLILLRETFKKLSEFSEPLVWEKIMPEMVSMVADSLGALLIFVIVGLYYRIREAQPLTESESEQATFIALKKLVALGLLVIFTGLGLDIIITWFQGGTTYPFFNSVYTILVFSAILIVLISLRYSMAFRVAFRNSAFAVTTVFILFALIAPAPLNAFIGVGTALFALGLLAAYNYYAPVLHAEEEADEAEREEHHEQMTLQVTPD